MLLERHFRAMNTGVGVWLWSTKPDAAAILDGAAAFFEECEQELSRFRKDSGLCRLNAAAGQGEQAVSATLREVIAGALEAARATNGLFDPTILPALEAAGYAGSFETIGPDTGATATQPRTRPGWREVQLGDRGVTLPAGCTLDLGGIAKGWTVDRLAMRLRRLGPVMVDAGGDIHAYGQYQGQPWPVGVANPFQESQDLAVIGLADEAIATSSIGKRTWQRGGKAMNHLIDPRTQQPVASDLHTVTVIAPSAAEAETHAKVTLLLGSVVGVKHLEVNRLSAILVRTDGSVLTAGKRLSLK